MRPRYFLLLWPKHEWIAAEVICYLCLSKELRLCLYYTGTRANTIQNYAVLVLSSTIYQHSYELKTAWNEYDTISAQFNIMIFYLDFFVIIWSQAIQYLTSYLYWFIAFNSIFVNSFQICVKECPKTNQAALTADASELYCKYNADVSSVSQLLHFFQILQRLGSSHPYWLDQGRNQFFMIKWTFSKE